jgi:biopolymer transport protein ExbB
MVEFGDHVAMLVDRGGYIMVPLLALSVIGLMLIFERIWFWGVTHRPARMQMLGRLNDALRRGQREVAEALVSGDESPYGRVATELLSKGPSDAVAVEAVETQRPRVDRFMVSLSTIVTAAPLLGILGTVVGIIQSFRLLGEQNTLTDPREVAGGIAAALLTTALGLIVALLTLFPYMAFRSQAGRALGRMESIIAAAQQGAEYRAELAQLAASVPDVPVETVRAPRGEQEGTPAAAASAAPTESRS